MRNIPIWALAVLLCGCQAFAVLDQPPRASFTVSPSLESIQVGDVVTLDASASSDPQGYSLSYEWELTSPTLSHSVLSSTSGVRVTFTPDSMVPYVVQLKVTARVQSDYSGSTSIEAKPADLGTSLITVLAGPEDETHGTVSPQGPRGVKAADGPLSIVATPDSGYRFTGWVVEEGNAVIFDPSQSSTTVSVLAGQRAVIRAHFEPSGSQYRFLGWTDLSSPTSQLVSLDTGTLEVDTLGGNVTLVALARLPGGTLYGLGHDYNGQGLKLYRINPANGAVVGQPIDLLNASNDPVTLSSLAVDPTGALWGLEAFGAARLVKVNADTGLVTPVGTSGVDLSSLAVSAQGGFFATDGTTLYQIDAKTGKTSKTIGSFGKTELLASLTFGGGQLFARDSDLNGTSLYLIDTASGKARVLATFEDSRLLALVSNP